jgi:cell filamentation protein
VFEWDGSWRTLRFAKGGSMFCYPEHIDAEMRKLFGRLAGDHFLARLPAATFADQVAHVLAELNAIHPFREGNGRTQLTYLTLLAARAGHTLALERMDPAAMLAAMVESFKADERPLANLIRGLFAS